MIGRLIDLNTKKIMTKIATIDTALTRAKSSFVMLIRSLVHGASPISIPLVSYLSRISSSLSHCALTSSDATAYSELTMSSSYSSFCTTFKRSEGSISFGKPAPKIASRPIVAFTPSTSFTSSIISTTSLVGNELSIR